MRAAAHPLFNPLEQQVLRLAIAGGERQAPRTAPARLMRLAADRLTARRSGGLLANPRLETLRSYAVRLREDPAISDRAMFEAGYTGEQAEAVRAMIKAAPRKAAARHDRMIYMSGIVLGLASITSFVGMTGALVMAA